METINFFIILNTVLALDLKQYKPSTKGVVYAPVLNGVETMLGKNKMLIKNLITEAWPRISTRRAFLF